MFKGIKGGLAFVLAFFCYFSSFALEISNRYYSPRNKERGVRSATNLIVLHTTEAPARSSLNKLCERGECHFCVTEEGQIFRIIERDREAFHAGRSMWRGQEDIDKYSIGIECVGYHDKAMPLIQLKAIRALVEELQKMYRLTDDRVVCHSHVAYGAPNRWHKKRHRGRKRCGMLFAMPSVRRVLGLMSRPGRDPDTAAGRLVVGDSYLNKVLYGKTDLFVATYRTASVVKPSSSPQVAQASPQPAQPRPQPTQPPRTPLKPLTRPTTQTPTTIADLMRQGYTVKACVTKKGETAIGLVGAKWKDPQTFYVIRNKITPGPDFKPERLEIGMEIWMK